jgi:hypothetical protein
MTNGVAGLIFAVLFAAVAFIWYATEEDREP